MPLAKRLPIALVDPLVDFDEYDMTFQVVLTSHDGLVLASDRLIVERGLHGVFANQHSYQQATSKRVIISDDKTVICAYAGGPNAGTLARHIATNCNPSGLSDLQWHNRLETEVKTMPPYQELGLDEVMVVRCDIVTAVKVIRQHDEEPAFTPANPFLFAGGDRYARQLPSILWHQSIDLDSAGRLAVLTVNQAHTEAPHLVGGGIDVVQIDRQGHITEQHFSDKEADAVRTKFIDHFHSMDFRSG
jgi:hypothetical protein